MARKGLVPKRLLCYYPLYRKMSRARKKLRSHERNFRNRLTQDLRNCDCAKVEIVLEMTESNRAEKGATFYPKNGKVRKMGSKVGFWCLKIK